MILTTPSARSEVAARLFLIAPPPLLYEEGSSNAYHRFVVKSLKQFQNWFSSVSGCCWYVLETAAEWIIVPDGSVVDSHC
jgi:hypothetical protein